MKDEENLQANPDDIEREIAKFTTKYGMGYKQFVVKLERELGDPNSYELEQDAMRWESLVAEKKIWLEQLPQVDELVK